MRSLNFFTHLKLGIKLNVVALLVFSLLLAGVVLTTNRNLNSLILQTGRQNVEQEAQSIQARFAEIEQDTLNNTRFVVNTPGLLEALAAADIRTIRTDVLIGAARFDFDDLDVANAAGERLLEAGLIKESEEDRVIALALLGFETTGVIVEESDTGSKISLAAAVPVNDASGRTIGVVFASRVMDNEFLSRINIFAVEGMRLSLIVNGRVAANDFEHEEELEAFSAGLLDPTLLAQALSGQTVVANDLSVDAGIPHTLGHTPLTIGGDTRAVIGMVYELGELAAFQGQLAINQLIIFALITLAALTVLTVFTARVVVTPINHLRLAAEQLAGGDYTQRVSSTAKDEVGQLANSFNSMATQLSDLISSLEQRVADRTKALATVARVSTATATLLEIDKLLPEVVNLAKEQFNLYHAHIYIMSEAGDTLVLAAGAGEPGRQMVAEGRTIPLNREQSLVARAARNREGVTVNDVTLAADFLPNPLLPNTRSELAVPLIVGNTVLGVYDVQSDQVDHFTRADVDVQTTLAGQIAVAIQNAQQFSLRKQAEVAIAKRANELTTVARVSSAAATILDTDKLLLEVVNLTKEQFNLYHSHIYLLNEAGTSLVLVAGAGEPGRQMVAEGRSISLSREQSLVARAARERQGVIINDVTQAPDFLANPLLPETRSELAVPLIVGDKVIGVFDVQSDQVDRFTPEDLNIQTTLASQIAVAIQNVRAFSQAQRQAEREAMLNAISQKIQGATSVDAVLQIAARELGRALGAPRTIAQLGIRPVAVDSSNGNGRP